MSSIGWRTARARVACLALAAVVLGGCAAQRIRDDAQDALRNGNYEQALKIYEAGLQSHPDSALLRSGFLQARTEARARLVAEAAAERSAQRWEQAEQLLKRAQSLDSEDARTAALLADLAIERRQHAALGEAEALAAKQDTAGALRVIEQALKDNRRHTELLALQRRLEMEQRHQQMRAAQAGLAERRPISLDFRDANLRTVLDVVSRNSGINFILDKDIRQDVRVTVFLRRATVEDALDLITSTHQLAKKVIDGQTILIYPNTPDKRREHQEQVVKVFYLSSAEAKGAAAFLRSMLKITEPYVDERSNMLAIRDTQETVQLAERLVSLYDTSEPEVLLEVEVIEIRRSRLTELGIKFPEAFALTPLGPSGSTGGLTLGNVDGINSDRIGLNIGGISVNLKRDVGDFNTLANPRIRARNKQKAKILIGDKVPVITATTGTGGFVSDSVSYVDVGLKLEVEPVVYPDDEVGIRVDLEVSSVSREIATASGSLAYQIGTRNASTLLRLRDGETQLLAGLISSEDRSNASRVPGIGDLPVLGRLFSSQRDDTSKTELVLAITPRVLRNLRRPEATETELWVGTEAAPRLRPVGGRLLPAAAPKPDAQRPAAQAGEPPQDEDVLTTPPPPERAEPKLKWSGPGTVKAGDTFVLTLQLDTPVALRGTPMQFTYAKDRLRVLDVEEGDFFRQSGAGTSFTKTIQAEEGRFRVGVLRNQATGARGQGQVLTVRVKALAAGTAEIALVDFEPIGLTEAAARPKLPQAFRVEVQ